MEEFNTLSFEIEVAPEIFPQIIDAMLGDLDFAVEYIDDILIKSRNREDQVKYVKLVF